MVPEYELFELDDKIDNIAIVQYPAIEIGFLCFSKDEPKKYYFADDEKMELVGAFLVPEMRILRYNEKNEPYNVFFSADTVKKIAYDFLSNRQFNLGHNTDTDKLVLLESWLKESDEDKSSSLGLDVPIGTWLGKVKVNDDAIWAAIKSGAYNGFSIAGSFTTNKSEDFAAQTDDEKLLESIKKLISEYDG